LQTERWTNQNKRSGLVAQSTWHNLCQAQINSILIQQEDNKSQVIFY
jgi:hypothetical protein